MSLNIQKYIDSKNTKLQEIEALANTLIAKHIDVSKHGQWTFVWNDAVNILGMCKHSKKQIVLSKRWTLGLPDEEVLDTILHEIAHVIAGWKVKSHGIEWQNAAILVGAKPVATYSDDAVQTTDVAKPTYQMVDHTGKVYKNYYRKPTQKVLREVHTYYIKGRREETKGTFKIVKVDILESL